MRLPSSIAGLTLLITLACLTSPLPAQLPLFTLPEEVSTPFLEPDEIRGTLSAVSAQYEPGRPLAAGEPLVITFDYTTDAPGEFAVGAEIETDDGQTEHLIHEPAVLANRRGRGCVRLAYAPLRSAPDLRVKLVRVYLYPAQGALGRKDVAELPGPFHFEGTEVFTRGLKEKLLELEREVRELKATVRDLRRQVEL